MNRIETVPLTKEGFEFLSKELDHLKSVERPQVIEAISEARSHGDLKENAEYHAARERQGFIEARIGDLEEKLARAEIIDHSDKSSGTVRFGAWVLLRDETTDEEKKYRIVGDLEADISQNKLSISSPMARALLGKKEDDVIEIEAPRGAREYTILGIEY
jgi:transcription elongation factor GreA